MATKIRLQRHGKKGKPFFHIVVADARARRDGKFIERLGFYNPTTIPATIELNHERALYWITTGAEPTNTANAILRYKGVLHHKHLLNGVTKGALTAEQAEAKFQEFMTSHQAKVIDHTKKAVEKKTEKNLISINAGAEKAKAKAEARLNPVVVAEAVEESVEEPQTEESPIVETQQEEQTPEVVVETPVVEAQQEEQAPEVVAEQSAEEAPADEEKEG
ncbi:MAG: 30S ribosomal protein S16 [Bacteroidetes bacterium]|nr:30S ribosomal protein S16 [Bacteroidota bacterium]